MKIEIGKFYKTRDGKKVRIYITDSGNLPYTIHAGILTSNTWAITLYTKDGKCYEDLENPEDVISEWPNEDEKGRLLASH